MNLPEVRIFRFLRDDQGTFNKAEGVPFSKVPDKLFIDEVRHPEKIMANRMIRGRERNGRSYVFQTGIRPILNLYYGDYYEIQNGQKKNSFILFDFQDNGHELILHFFNNYKLFPRSREKFVRLYLGTKK